MRTVPYWHVDAFADGPFSGNQAAVMILDGWPDDAVLQAIGAENNFAETAFLVRDRTGAADWELRWFTPTVEIRLCGHATLASGHVLLAQEPAREAVRFRTRKAGVLEVRRTGGRCEDGQFEDGQCEVALPAIPVAPGAWPEAVAAMGAPPLELLRSPDQYNLFVYATEAEVRALRPDLRALAALGPDAFIASAPGDRSDIVSRVFVPGSGVDEDPVTGSAHALLTPYWAARLGRTVITAHQASARGGSLTCRLEGDLEGDRIWLGGSCVTVVEGRFTF